jgi:hypothetical protein
MKTTLEIPDTIFKQAKSAAAEQGIPLREFVSNAVAEKLRQTSVGHKPWIELFGGLRDLHEETVRINGIIAE